MDTREVIDRLINFRDVFVAISNPTYEAVTMAIAALEQQERERWRSIEKEGNPDEDGEYLITWESPKNGRRFIADVECEVYEDGTGMWILPGYMETYHDVKIVAWRPIPDPYKEETDG